MLHLATPFQRPGERPRSIATTAELVGVAASGKSSVLRALREHDGRLVAGRHPAKSDHLAHVIPLIPTFAALHRPFSEILWKEMKRITYLRTLSSVRQPREGGGLAAVVYDEGPVYMLARLLAYGGKRIRSAAFERWWREEVARWSRRLHLVVWLDAPDRLLLHRARARGQLHKLQAFSDREAERFFATYRRAYGLVIEELTRDGGPRVLRVRSDRESVRDIVRRVLAELDLGERSIQ